MSYCKCMCLLQLTNYPLDKWMYRCTMSIIACRSVYIMHIDCIYVHTCRRNWSRHGDCVCWDYLNYLRTWLVFLIMWIVCCYCNFCRRCMAPHTHELLEHIQKNGMHSVYINVHGWLHCFIIIVTEFWKINHFVTCEINKTQHFKLLP